MKKPIPFRWRLLSLVSVLGFVAGYVLRSLRGSQESISPSKLLDWPFLTFLMLACFVLLFYDSIAAITSRGEFTIAWGKDQSIKIRNLSSAVSGELTPIQEDVESLKAAVAALRGRTGVALLSQDREETTYVPISTTATAPRSPEMNFFEAKERRLMEALGNPKFKWRSIERLASIIGSTEDEVMNLLMTREDVRLSRSMTGHQIAGLRSRVGFA